MSTNEPKQDPILNIKLAVTGIKHIIDPLPLEVKFPAILAILSIEFEDCEESEMVKATEILTEYLTSIGVDTDNHFSVDTSTTPK